MQTEALPGVQGQPPDAIGLINSKCWVGEKQATVVVEPAVPPTLMLPLPPWPVLSMAVPAQAKLKTVAQLSPRRRLNQLVPRDRAETCMVTECGRKPHADASTQL